MIRTFEPVGVALKSETTKKFTGQPIFSKIKRLFRFNTNATFKDDILPTVKLLNGIICTTIVFHSNKTMPSE